MLQLARLHRRAREALASRGTPLSWTTPEDLDSVADHAISTLRALRTELADGARERALNWFDRRLDSDAIEYLDRPDYPEPHKLRQVRLLHLQNHALGFYGRFLDEIRPALEESAGHRGGRPVRVLELACGSGELTLELSRRASAVRDFPNVELTGSDVVAAYVDDANRRAAALGRDARFRRVNAFALEELFLGEVDVAFIAQSMHHFTPGQLARMIASLRRAGARHFIGLDGYRSFRLLGGATLLAAVTLHGPHTHDAWLSARKMYTEGELALIADIAAPGARVRVRTAWPAFSVLSVDFVREKAS